MSDNKTTRARLTLAAIGVLVVGALVGGGITAATLIGGDDKPSAKSSPSGEPSAKPTPSGKDGYEGYTPAKVKPIVLDKPTGQKDGLSTGFSFSAKGAISTAVYFWEEFAFLDDQKARQQLDAIVSKDDPSYVDQQVSEVRKLREDAGLPPSGGTPAGITFTTNVNAAVCNSLDHTGKILQVWLNYDRYATKADGSPDTDPFKDQDTHLILKWQDGAWKITNEPKYAKQLATPTPYLPNSNLSFRAGWRQVQHAG
ncbi:hypothetical protein [Streptomyces sp. NPDC054834]